MPNWCSNTLIVSGDPEKVAEFVEKVKGVEFDEEGTPKGEVALDFESILPMPDHLRGTKSPSDDGSMTWYEWQRDNWGVKWGACSSSVEYRQGDSTAIYEYDTAWGPAINWLEVVMSHFDSLNFIAKWHETGMGFAGELESEKGILGPIKEWDAMWDEETESVVPIR